MYLPSGCSAHADRLKKHSPKTTGDLVMQATRKATISEAPLIGLFGSKAAYLVLMYLENYGQGYAAEIARTFGMSLSQVQNQLRKFEELSLLVSRKEGPARFYYFNRNPVADHGTVSLSCRQPRGGLVLR